MSVLDRQVIPAGKVFIKAGDVHARAYIVQNGLVQSFVEEDDQKIIVAEYEPGRIIGETCLMIDEPMNMSYEAVETSTVVTITRQDFKQKIASVGQDVMQILETVMNKLNYMDTSAIDKAKNASEIDPQALALTQAFVKPVPDARKFAYEKAILPHINGLIKAIKEMKNKDWNEG